MQSTMYARYLAADRIEKILRKASGGKTPQHESINVRTRDWNIGDGAAVLDPDARDGNLVVEGTVIAQVSSTMSQWGDDPYGFSLDAKVQSAEGASKQLLAARLIRLARHIRGAKVIVSPSGYTKVAFLTGGILCSISPEVVLATDREKSELQAEVARQGEGLLVSFETEPLRLEDDPRPPHDHDCTCHLGNPPCGSCENCNHFNDPDCGEDCQECEIDHDE